MARACIGSACLCALDWQTLRVFPPHCDVVACCLRGCAGPLQEQSIHFAGRAAAFAARRGWPLLAAVLRQFQLHLRHGCTLEVVPLLALGCVDTPTARLLHNAGGWCDRGGEALLQVLARKVQTCPPCCQCAGAGLTTLEAVAEAGEEELVAALRHAPTPRWGALRCAGRRDPCCTGARPSAAAPPPSLHQAHPRPLLPTLQGRPC